MQGWWWRLSLNMAELAEGPRRGSHHVHLAQFQFSTFVGFDQDRSRSQRRHQMRFQTTLESQPKQLRSN